MKKKWVYNILIIIFALLFLGSTGRLVSYFLSAHQTSSDLDELADIKEESAKSDFSKSDKTSKELADFAELKKMNGDIAGWIEIKDTKINYPIMQTPKDEQYYLHRNFKKEDDANGLPFLSKDSDFSDEKGNLMIYGHHMKSGLMFAHLLDYKDKKFWQKHPVVHITSLTDRMEFEVVAAFYSQIRKEKEEGFRFYQFSGHLSEKDFDEYIEQSRKLSLYDTGIIPSYGEQLITLVTCSYHTEEGRFVVVARKKQTATEKEASEEGKE